MQEFQEIEGVTELSELGAVSEETRGGIFGHQWDGGFGYRFP